MTSDADYKNRQLIPRWNLSSISVKIGDALDLYQWEAGETDTVETLARKRRLWNSERSSWAGIDLLGTTLVLHASADTAMADGVRHLSNIKLSHSQQVVLRAAAGRGAPALRDEGESSASMHSLRRRLFVSPGDALAWMDLAYFYELRGDKKRADRSIRTAVSLAPDNRLVLRATARLYTHREEPDAALRYLRRSRYTSSDPWLLAAEISVAEAFGLRTQNAKVAARLVSEMDTHPLNKTELLGTLSTYECRHGTTHKWGRRWLNMALTTPNENTLAQAEYLVTRHRLGIDVDGRTAPFDYEARAVRAYSSESFKDAIKYARKWSEYQPLSSRPLLLGSYISSVIMNDSRHAITLIEDARGSITYSDPMVINNLAFALANEGQTGEADRQLRRVSPDELDADKVACITATRGLIAFRSGEFDFGRIRYEEAIAHFRRNRDHDRLSRALMFYGRELIRTKDEKGLGILREAMDIAKKHNVRDVQLSATQTLEMFREDREESGTTLFGGTECSSGSDNQG